MANREEFENIGRQHFPEGYLPGDWLAEDKETKNIVAVYSRQLKRMRPALWRAWGEKELSVLSNQLREQQATSRAVEASTTKNEEDLPGVVARCSLVEDDE